MSLTIIPAIELLPTIALSFGAAFTNCTSLIQCSFYTINSTTAFTNCKLGKDALVEIFNNLGIATAKTITITGNPGASLLTAADRLIATNKGWTIVG